MAEFASIADNWTGFDEPRKTALIAKHGEAAILAALTGEGSLRLSQRPPGGDWLIWAILAGRGFGKTHAGAEWVHALAQGKPKRFALVGASLEAARSVMVEGESGLLARLPPGGDVTFIPSLRQLHWENGSQARLFSGGEPDSVRGGQFDFAWGDEFAHWPRAEATLTNLRMATRLAGLISSMHRLPRRSRLIASILGWMANGPARSMCLNRPLPTRRLIGRRMAVAAL